MPEKNRISFGATFFAIIFSFSVNAEEDLHSDSNHQTIVEADVNKSHDAQYSYVKEKNSGHSFSDSALLFHIPGVSLNESGGPLGVTEISYRGLSNSRLGITLDGLDIGNPTTGINDANAMFLFATEHLVANGQSLSLTLPTFSEPYAKGVIGYGSHNAVKVGAMAARPVGDRSHILVASQFSTTNGQFDFSQPQLASGAGNNFSRRNNDNTRLQGVMKYQHLGDANKYHGLFAVNANEGAIPGFALSPTLNLRSKSLYAGASFGAARKYDTIELSFELANSYFDYQSKEGSETKQNFTTSRHELTLGFKNLQYPKWMDMDIFEKLIVEHSYELNKTRIGGGIVLDRIMTYPGRLKPTVFSTFSMLGFHNEGLVFKKDLGVSIQAHRMVDVTARFTRSQRLPTFMELYAANQFFVGNEALEKESIWDIELGSNLRISDHTRIHVSAYVGFLSDHIVYVPFLGTKLRPVNAEYASRYGVDLGLDFEPLDWLHLESKNAFLKTRIKSSGAPLPQSPLFSGLSKLRLGNSRYVALNLQSRYKTSSTANLYGTLKTKGYALFDASILTTVIPHVNLSFSVNNIFNVKTARDSYETPLPGRVYFAQIELENI